MPLTVTDCIVTTNSITITFSDPLFPKPTNTKPLPLWGDSSKTSALNPKNYAVSDPGSTDFKTPTSLDKATVSILGSVDKATRSVVTITFPANEFSPADWITVVMHNIQGVPETGDQKPELEGNFALIVRQVPGTGATGRRIKDMEDAISYPILTEEVGYPPATMGRPGAGIGLPSAGGPAKGLGQTAAQAVADVLGWKPNASDPKGFIGALTQSFSLTEVEGHVESKWNPRTYTVQTDLAGGITGAQASLYARAQDAQTSCVPLLDGLYPLDPDADPEYVRSLREMAKSQISEIVKQFGVVPPSILRVNLYFKILLGHSHFHFGESAEIMSDPDKIGGTLGAIRDIYGIFFMKNDRDNPFSNSVEDEQDITNFRVISDYMTSLLLTWLSNGRYFELSTNNLPAFLGTQLVLISRQLNVIAETVNEVRFALDSVFIGPNERQTLLLVFPDSFNLPAMYLEDVLTEIEGSVTNELPLLIKDGGRIAINNNMLPVVQTLRNMIEGAKEPKNGDALPDGYSTARVKHSLDDLSDQLMQLQVLGQQVGMDIPRPRYPLIEGGALVKTR